MPETQKSRTPSTKLLLLLLALSFLSFFISCKSDYPASARQGPPGGAKGGARQVKTTAVVEAPFGETVNANGTLAAFDQTTVSLKVPGRLQAINVDLGSVVRKGQVIA